MTNQIRPAAMMRKIAFALLLLFALLMLNSAELTAQSPRSGTIFTVNTTDSAIDFTCNASHCSLYEAIYAANTHTGINTIRFDFTSPTTFAPQIPLPPVTKPIVIDGITGTGSSCPTGSTAGNFKITLSGVNLPANSDGIRLGTSSGDASGSQVQGLNIINFSDAGIRIESDDNIITCNHIGLSNSGVQAGNGVGVEIGSAFGGNRNRIGGIIYADRNVISGNDKEGIFMLGEGNQADCDGSEPFQAGAENEIYGNYIGTDLSGSNALGNGSSGIALSGWRNKIGAASLASRNIISGNGSHGIRLFELLIEANENIVDRNYIGTAKNGFDPLGNGGHGISLEGASDTVIGTSFSSRPTIANNAGDGVHVGHAVNGPVCNIGSERNQIRYASIHSNGGLGINLFHSTSGGVVGPDGEIVYIDETLEDSNGVSYNLLVADANGPNNGADHPILYGAIDSGFIDGRLDALAGSYQIDVYESERCDGSGYGEGQTWLEGFSVTVDSGMDSAEFSILLANPTTTGNYISLTATDSVNNTSEFGNCEQIVEADSTFTVNSTGNGSDLIHGNGVCEAPNGLCTLRAAIQEVNALTAGATPKQILFDLEAQIIPGSVLPTITKAVKINGISRNGDASCPVGYSAGDLHVRLNGGNLSGTANGLTFGAGSAGSTVRGLSITNFPGDGIKVATDNFTATCNLIGIGLNGTSDFGNGGNGITIDGGDNSQIGGTGGHQRNIISGNAGNGIELISLANDSIIQGNIIGLDAAGTAKVENGLSGISIGNGNNNIIGSSDAGGQNLIAGNTVAGVIIAGTAAGFNQVVGNWIGLGADGVASAETEQVVNILIDGASDNTIGGSTPTDGNLIGRSSFIGSIQFNGTSAHDNLVQHNYIGINFDGSDADSKGYGILVSEGGSNNLFDNTIRFMEKDGIGVSNIVDEIRIGRNSIYDNGELGIDLGLDGITPNDTQSDPDSGANTLINFPEMRGAFTNGRIELSIDGSSSVSYRIDVYESDSCDASTHGEGQRWLGNGFSNGGQNTDFTVPTVPTHGKQVTATVTDPDGNTSEFSACEDVVERILNVDTLGDSVAGPCSELIPGSCTLRKVIDIANAEDVGPVRIKFLVLAGTIAPISPLPAITQQVIMAADTGVTINCPTAADDGSLFLNIDGATQGSGSGLQFGIGSDGSVVRGLSLTNFPDDAIQADIGVTNLSIDCNLIGLTTSGVAAGNDGDGLDLAGEGHAVGTNDLNWIMHNGGAGVATSGLVHRIEGNRIENNVSVGLLMQDFGTEVYSNTVASNGSHGLFLSAANSAEIRYNTIDGNSGAGIRNEASPLISILDNTIINNANTGIALLSSVYSNDIRRNDIGIDGSTPAPNSLHGIHIEEFGTQNWIARNTIAHNTRNGIRVDATAINNEFSENIIVNNGWLGIDLGEDGKTLNDVGDGDFGANLLQNYATISSADSATGQITFDLDTSVGSYLVEFYRNDDCHSSEHGEGQEFLGNMLVSAGAAQSVTFGSGSFALSDELTTTVIQQSGTSRGNTSEFSPCYTVMVPTAIGLDGQAAIAPERREIIILLLTGLLLGSIVMGLRLRRNHL